MRQSSSAYSNARLFLENILSAQTTSDGARLPSLRELARLANVSHPTMRNAIRSMECEGRLHCRHGYGISVGPACAYSAPAAVTQRPLQWEVLYSKIVADILDGAFRDSLHLPSLKDLTLYYQVGYHTLQKALEALTKGNVLIFQKRRYCIQKYRGKIPNGRIALIIGADMGVYLNIPFYRQRMYNFLHALEKECGRLHISLRKETYDGGTISLGARLNDAQGFILWATEETKRNYEQLLSFLLQFQKPICGFDEIGDVALPDSLSAARYHYLFYLDDRKAGFQTGKFLLEMGHRHIAFFTRFSEALWVRRRIEGIRHAFQSAGYGSGVENYYTGESAEFDKALESRGISAWVFSDDEYAVRYALPYFKQKGIRIPEDLSIVVFNDTIDALYYDLSSYDFDIQGMAHIMLHLIFFAPSYRKKASIEHKIRLEGSLVVRNSVRIIEA
jgi:DNA-binding transcriptional regulator YhcF (GntR family)